MYQGNYDAFVSTAAGGDCGNVDAVRDERSLREECLPSISTVACDQLVAGQIDGSCASQLQRTSSGLGVELANMPGAALARATFDGAALNLIHFAGRKLIHPAS